MSWTDVFPVFSNEQLTDYQNNVSQEESLLLRDWCEVAQTINPQSGRHIVSASLFWKNCAKDEPELPPITRTTLMDAKELGLVSRFAPWEHYVQPLLDGTRTLKISRPDIVVRVYLAADLEFLVSDLVAAGCEIKLMRSSSLRHNPGALWRFLALEEQDRWVTVTDSDRARIVLHDVERTEKIMKSGLGLWRAPYVFGSIQSDDRPGFYRPIIACQFGSRGGHPVEALMKAFLWHTLRGTMPDQCTLRMGRNSRKLLPIFGTEWPTYGFDEWFLLAALYPRLALTGVLTFFPLKDAAANRWLILDIEYVTWANPNSEVLYFGNADVLKNRKLGDKKSARSSVLRKLLKKPVPDLHCPCPAPSPKPRDHLTLVVARYHEEIQWLLDLPPDITIVLYNKGPNIADLRLLKRIDHLHTLPNTGREADTYLHHLGHHPHEDMQSWTVFTQADPFPHSPQFIQLLEHRDSWSDVQALTRGYIENTPPAVLTELETSEWIHGLPVRTELCSVRTMDYLSYDDHSGRRWAADYREHHGVPPGWSIGGHFLERCGLRKLAEKAWNPVIATTAHGAIFGVRNCRLSQIDVKCLPRMRKLAAGHYSHGYVFERLWLHLFGLPFINVRNNTTSPARTPPREAAIP